MVWHPWETGKAIYNGVSTLVGHLANFEWDEATQQLFPELYQLATQWNTLSDYDKGYLIGKVLGQYGSGVLTGVGIAKILKQLKALKAGRSTVQPKSCFPAGTPVATGDGLRPIETVSVGDLVWAYDLVASEWRLCRVKRPYDLPYQGTFVYATMAGERIASTYRHPYWVVRGEELESRPWLEHLAFIPKEATTPGRWVDSCDLRVGDEVLLRDGRIVPVERVEFGPFEGTVYNMEVEELQCYTVGQNSVLVHNNSGPATGPGQGGVPTPPKLNPPSASRPVKPGNPVSVGGASLQSHSTRPGWPGPKPKGNPAAINAQAQALVDEIMANPNRTITTRPHPRPEWGGTVTDVYRPDCLGVRFDANGNFVGFITR